MPSCPPCPGGLRAIMAVSFAYLADRNDCLIMPNAKVSNRSSRLLLLFASATRVAGETMEGNNEKELIMHTYKPDYLNSIPKQRNSKFLAPYLDRR